MGITIGVIAGVIVFALYLIGSRIVIKRFAATTTKTLSELNQEQKEAFALVRPKHQFMIAVLIILVIIYTVLKFTRDLSSRTEATAFLLFLSAWFAMDSWIYHFEMKQSMPVDYMQKRKRVRKFYLVFLSISAVVAGIFYVL